MSFRLKTIALLALLSLGPLDALGQAPDTDIWLVDVRGEGKSLNLGKPVNVTQRLGYDNQPCFLPGGQVADYSGEFGRHAFLFTQGDSLGATDIYRWDPASRAATQVTRTDESEYSPTPIVGKSGCVGFHTVRVEANGAQRLWRFDMDGLNPEVVMEDVDSIGYFAWIDEDEIAAFVLGNEEKKEPHTLRVIDVGAQTERIVARDIGRAIQRIPGTHDISFTLRDADDTYRFLVLKRGGYIGQPVIEAMGAGQDSAWLNRETLLMSAGAAIYLATPKDGHGSWQVLRDFSDVGISGITRLVVSPDRKQIAFVAVTLTP